MDEEYTLSLHVRSHTSLNAALVRKNYVRPCFPDDMGQLKRPFGARLGYVELE